MTKVERHNRDAWDEQVRKGNPWTVPASSETIERARGGRVELVLTPTKIVPLAWYGELPGSDVLCLASGGGQQAPILAAAGARVTTLDNSPAQLAQDDLVAKREGLEIRLELGVMADLSRFEDQSFDLIFHPVSNCFAPEIRPVWREAFRVLRPGGTLLAGFNNPWIFIFDWAKYEAGELVVRHTLPYADLTSLDEAELAARIAAGEPLEFGHSLDDQIGGQLDAGFLLAGLYEDALPDDLASRYAPTFIATRAVKPASPAEGLL